MSDKGIAEWPAIFRSRPPRYLISRGVEWGINLELSVQLALSVVGKSVFARFEIETPEWRRFSETFYKMLFSIIGETSYFGWLA
jgi:hypothetical protein